MLLEVVVGKNGPLPLAQFHDLFELTAQDSCRHLLPIHLVLHHGIHAQPTFAGVKVEANVERVDGLIVFCDSELFEFLDLGLAKAPVSWF